VTIISTESVFVLVVGSGAVNVAVLQFFSLQQYFPPSFYSDMQSLYSACEQSGGLFLHLHKTHSPSIFLILVNRHWLTSSRRSNSMSEYELEVDHRFPLPLQHMSFEPTAFGLYSFCLLGIGVADELEQEADGDEQQHQ
jgi:hypothetical protein